MQNFGGKQGVLGEMRKWRFHPFCANPPAFTRTRRIGGAILLVDRTVPSESNTSAKFREKLLKY